MQEFLRNRKVLHTFYATAHAATALATSCGGLQANRNDFYFFRNAGRLEVNPTNRSWDYIQPMIVALRNVAAAVVLRRWHAVIRCIELQYTGKQPLYRVTRYRSGTISISSISLLLTVTSNNLMSPRSYGVYYMKFFP